ncbi:MAG: Asp-tRNA(Asn)/Glu-tRNA(Gln) amidotransferase subunit GatC [Verrucomicrobiae bacterium]|nr:Asp-tRNA(Asn)/Glu-tRNA(Gln) amidotransferase subunit GatC [Verrucomicrobiae bacterium]
MSAPSSIDVGYVAQLARLKLSEEETRRFQGQLEQIVRYIEQIRRLDVAGIEPTAHAVDRSNVTRDDAAAPSLSSEEALANAPVRANGLFMVPKVIE